MMLRLDWVLSSVDGELIKTRNSSSLPRLEAINFSGVSTDSRRIKRDELFFALTGENFDGHEFVREALEKGAEGAVVEKEIPGVRTNGKVLIKVPSTLRAFGDLASAWRKGFPDLKLAAVTGSNGKTTTKEMVWSILSVKFSVLKNTGNLNNLIGLPLTLLKITENHEAVVVELGMNQFGEIRRLAEIALPDTGAITNIGRAHMEKLGGIEGVARAKAELVEGFTERNTLVVNMDDPRVRGIAQSTRCKIITFGMNNPKVEITAMNLNTVDFSALRFDMVIGGKEFPVRLRGIGFHNVLNALCAGGVALSFGCDVDEIQAGLERFTPPSMRLEVMEAPNGFKIINDTYNANPDSMRRGIEEVVRLKGSGKAIAVLGDMLELGAFSKIEHLELGRFISENEVDFVITLGQHGIDILAGIDRKVEATYAKTHEEAAEILIRLARRGDLVLVKGSRGMNMEDVIRRIFER